MSPELKEDTYIYAVGNRATTVNKTGEWRFLTPEKTGRISPCRSDCLLDGEVPRWLEAVKKGQWAEAWETMKGYNPFPALTGYVCFHPCTENCNRGQLDREIDIPAVEKAIGEWRLENYEKPKTPKEVKARVAVVGSGPAGLSCAFYLAEAGYRVTVIERSNLPGGMLALGIPDYRLPRRVLRQELAILEDLGIEFKTGCSVGKDVSLADLDREFERVFLATGAWVSRKADIKGEESADVYDALDFLCRVNTEQPPKIKDPVIVIGGGNAAVDSARTALRMNGINHVSLVYRRSRAEMPAFPPEVEAAENEGVEMIYNALPREIEMDAQVVKAVVFDYSKTNREGLVVDSSRTFKKDCGTVIMALGQEQDLSILEEAEQPFSLFAGGDLVTGPATVTEAIKAGRVAAEAIRAQLEGLPLPALSPGEEEPVKFEELNLVARFDLQLLERQPEPEDEADRCLGCGTCNSCGICYLFCPDLAVNLSDGNYEINLDFCKGCGICATECPARALAMEGGR